MSLRTKEPRYQATLMSSSRWHLTGKFVRSLPEEIRCCPKHSTMFVAGFVAVKRTESTRTFLYIQLSQQNSIYRGKYAHATPCGCSLKIFSAFMSPMFPSYIRQTAFAYARHIGRKESRRSRLLSLISRQRSSLWCDLRVVVWTSNM
jgi:hypothetical protein